MLDENNHDVVRPVICPLQFERIQVAETCFVPKVFVVENCTCVMDEIRVCALPKHFHSTVSIESPKDQCISSLPLNFNVKALNILVSQLDLSTCY